jgi:ribonuclease Z
MYNDIREGGKGRIMAEIVILGSGGAEPDANHDNTNLVVKEKNAALLIDCGGSPVPKLKRLGINKEDVSHLILTHRHLDHVYSLPSLIQSYWLARRQRPLLIYGNEETLNFANRLLDLHTWRLWPNMFQLVFHILTGTEREPVFYWEDYAISVTSVRHGVPTIAVKFSPAPESSQRTVFAYSADTQPCQSMIDLAHHVDILIHEAGGGTENCIVYKNGHSTARQAALVAKAAEVGELVLVHYPIEKCSANDLLAEAQTEFGNSRLAVDDEHILLS